MVVAPAAVVNRYVTFQKPDTRSQISGNERQRVVWVLSARVRAIREASAEPLAASFLDEVSEIGRIYLDAWAHR
jgi:hypothetical protein